MTKALFAILVGILIYTRFVGLGWGLPYPMNPDERNMVDAILRLKCEASSFTSIEGLRACFNPQFFAYGQLPLYLAYSLIWIWQAFDSQLLFNFSTATLSLRIVSAVTSVALAIVMTFVVAYVYKRVYKKELSRWMSACALLLVIFQPYLVQASHFGTTESVLMLLYVLIVYMCFRMFAQLTHKHVILLAVLIGVAVGIKASAAVFIVLPACVILYSVLKRKDASVSRKIRLLARYGLVGICMSSVFYFLSSPHNILSWKEFVQSMDYELAVGNGTLKVFYTAQFDDTIPYLFQFTHIFPYALGLPGLLLSIVALLFLPWRNRYINTIRLAWFLYFVFIGGTYIKWARFMAPIMPFMTILASVLVVRFLQDVQEYTKQKFAIYFARVIVILVMIIPGIAYLHIYQISDVRFIASRVIAERMPEGAKVFEEAGNVINIPVSPPETELNMPSYYFSAVDVYTIDTPEKYAEVQSLLNEADYVIVPSRRIFASRTCLTPSDVSHNALVKRLLLQDCELRAAKYSYHQVYYSQLFGKSNPQFVHVATISSYPKIVLFGKTILEFPDEFAEETWSVFDHPVVRMYERL